MKAQASLFNLQGQFSFVVFDSSKRRLFAARDASGTEPLYINTEEDGAMAFTNSPTSSLADKCDTWQEVGLPCAYSACSAKEF